MQPATEKHKEYLYGDEIIRLSSELVQHSQLLPSLSTEVDALLKVIASQDEEWTYCEFNKQFNPPPSPPKLPLIGNLHQLGPSAHQSFQEPSKKYGPIMLLHLGEIPTLVVSSPHMAREVLRTHDSVFASRPQFKAATILSYNHHDIAFAPYGEQRRSLRKITSMHLFSSKRVVQTFKTLREEEVLFMLNKVKEEPAASPKGIVNMRKTFYKLTNDIICHIITGESFIRDGREEKFMNMVFDSIPLLGKFNPEDIFPSLKWIGPIIGSKEQEGTRTSPSTGMAYTCRGTRGQMDQNTLLSALSIEYGGQFDLSDANTINGQPGDFMPCSSNDTFKVQVQQSKMYLLRVINAAMENEFFFAV
ncbi:cytochrome P450 71A1-like protein [Carex littledalei]|uniref:Cytochrome P450 71A1-like protein n=1 Tax=Carex littledalei TaxID=544730 RepID=A0A833QYI3_9POAL|nr:cytochrome P450 71A1-like protein [Carex littledalei]